MEGTAVKDQVALELMVGIYAVLVKAGLDAKQNELQKVQNVIYGCFRDVDITKMETALSVERDHNRHIIEAFVVDYTRRGRSKKTIEQYLYAIKDLLCYVDKDLRKMTTSDIMYYLDLYGRENQATTYNNQMRNLSAFYTWLRKVGEIKHHPVENIDPRKEIQKPVDYLSEIEIMHIRDASKNIRDRALVEFLLSTGVRVGELVLIRMDQVDWREGIVRNVYAGKTSDYRDVFLTPVAAHLLKKYLDSRTDHSPYLFVSRIKPFSQLTERGVDDIMRRLGKRSGLDRRVYPHLFRHTMATMAHEHGAKLEDIQYLLGHASPATTAKFYTAVTTTYLKNVHARYCAGW